MAPASILVAQALDVDEWLSKLTSARTRHAYLADLRAFFRWAQRRGLAERNPTALVDGVKVPASLPRPVSTSDLAAVFAVANADLQLQMMLGALAGLRIGEVATLEAGDVHLDADPPVLLVREGKGAKDRIVPLHPTLQRMLRDRPRAGWVFPSPGGGGRHIRTDSLCERLLSACRRAGVSFTSHQLRHYFGTEAARWSEGNMVLVAQLMGHSSPQTTAGYVGWVPTTGAEVVAKIQSGTNDELAARRGRRAG